MLQSLLLVIFPIWGQMRLCLSDRGTFKCEEKTIEVHTLILASGSPLLLAAMFQRFNITPNETLKKESSK